MEFDPVGSAQSIPHMIKNDTPIEVLDQDQLSECLKHITLNVDQLSSEIKQISQKTATKHDARAQTQQISTPQTQNQAVNKNIEELKKIPKTKENFGKIYEICQRIATENDKDAMSFAVREKFIYVTEEYDNVFTKAARDNKLDLVRLLIVFGIDINCRSKFNYTALILASDRGHHEVVKLLLTVPGIDVNAKDKFNHTALIYASCYGRHEVVKLLLTVPGIDVNAKDNLNDTALILASCYDRHEVVKLLLTVPGIDVNAKDIWNNTALSDAETDEIRKMLKNHGAIE